MTKSTKGHVTMLGPNQDVHADDAKILSIRKFSRGFNFRETSHMRSFVKIKSSRNAEITMLLIDICKSCASREFLASQICPLINVIRENKILAKISGFIALQFTFTAPVRKS